MWPVPRGTRHGTCCYEHHILFDAHSRLLLFILLNIIHASKRITTWNLNGVFILILTSSNHHLDLKYRITVSLKLLLLNSFLVSIYGNATRILES